jgi:branched-chain amino acid transport system substrate-binding protein
MQMSEHPSRRFVLAGGAATLASPLIRTARAQSTSGPINVGFIVPLTGAYGADTALEVKGGEVAIKQFNEVGGLNGRMANLLVRDDSLNPGIAATRAQELIEKDGAHVLAGCFGAAMLSVNTIAKQRGIVYNPIGNNDAINTAAEWAPTTFHDGLNPFMTSGALARYVIPKLGKSKRVACLIADFVLGNELAKAFIPVAEGLGAEIVGKMLHPLGSTDFSSFFPRIVSLKPDLLVVMNFGRDQQIAFKQAAEFRIKDRMKIAAPLLVHTARLVDGHERYEGIVGGTGYYWGLEDSITSARAFNDRFRAHSGGQNPSDYAALGYACVLTLLMAAKNAGTTDGPALAEAMLALQYDIYKGPQHYRRCDHQSVQSVLIITSKAPAEARAPDDIFTVLHIEPGSEEMLNTCVALGYK